MLLHAFLLTACNLGPKQIDTDSGTQGTGDDTGTSGTGATIADIRSGDIPIGEIATLAGVIVSSPHTRDDEGFFIQDPAGGPNSGLYVWGYSGVADIYAEMGAEVTVTGTVTDFYGWTEFVIDSASDVVETGTGTLPDPVDLGNGEGVDWEDYESVPVTLTNQTIESIDDYFAGYLSAGIKLDDGFVPLQYDCRGTYESITGIMFYSYETWSLNARFEADATGYADAEVLDATAYEIQQGGVCGPVRLTGVVATTGAWEDENGSYFFVQDESGGEWSGLTVFVREEGAAATIGDGLDATGVVTEYYGLTELQVDAVSDLLWTAGAGTPVASTVSAAPDDWESWEGCLVTVTDVTAESVDEFGNVTTNYAGLLLDDVLTDIDASAGTSWDSVTGALYYSYNEWKLLPRQGSDLAAE